MQERCTSSALAMDLSLSCTNPLRWSNAISHWLSPYPEWFLVIFVYTLRPGGLFKNAYGLVNSGALKFPFSLCYTSFNVWVRYFVWNFEANPWNPTGTQNILPIHSKIKILHNVENLRPHMRFWNAPLGCICNAVPLWHGQFPPKYSQRHAIARAWERVIRHVLWVQQVVYSLF